MDLACAVLSGSCSFPLKPPAAVSDAHSPSLHLSGNLPRNLSVKVGRCLLPVNKPRLQHLLCTTAGDTTLLPCDSNQENLSVPNWSEPVQSNANPKTDDETKDGGDEGGNLEIEDRKVRVYDKLIEVFMVDKPTPTDWRKLLVFSKTWSDLRSPFFEHCKERADNEDDPGMKHKLLRFSRKLKEVDDDIQRHNELFEAVRQAPSVISEVVARRRKDFTKEFFEHVRTVAESYYENPAEQDAVVELLKMCLAAVQAHDAATQATEALNAAELKFHDIMSSPSLDAARRKIDELNAKNQFDSALAMTVTKAWSDAKETTMMKDEAKDILYHLYLTARGNLQRLVPKEVRILKCLLMIKDPEERMSALNDAFTPGLEIEGEDVDTLYTTPENLMKWMKTITDAYCMNKEGSLIYEARDLVDPRVIQKIEELKKIVQDKFM